MLPKYVLALALGPVAGFAASGSVFAGYAGTWLVKFAGGNAMIYELRAEGSDLGGSVLQPKDLSYDSDGYFTGISAEHEEVPVTDAAMAETLRGVHLRRRPVPHEAAGRRSRHGG